MGQALTNSGVQSPNGQTQFFPSPGAAAVSFAKQYQPQPAVADVSGDSAPTYSTPEAPEPKMVKPSFIQAAEGRNGQPNAAYPGLSKAGKLVTLLTSGVQGALAGRAAQEQMIAQSGGRRAGGIGTGFQAGYALPFQRSEMENQLAQQQAQTELTRQQASMVQTPYGMVPQSLAKVLLPASIREQGTLGAAQTRAGATTQAAQIGAQSREKVAQIEQGQGIPVDPDTAQLAGFPELQGQTVGRGTWTNINKAMEAKGYRVQDMGKNGSDPNSGMWLMDRAGTRIRQVSPNSLTFQRGASFAQNKPEVVVDPNDPGYAYYTTAANAMNKNLPAPQGAGTVAAKTEARSEVPTKVGDQKVAFNTMIQHAQLLRNAAKALNNGDSQTLSGLKNAFKNEFGWSGPITSEAIADAYKGEVSNVINKGHITDTGNEKVAHTLDPAHQNYETLDSVLGAYQALAQSKLAQLSTQATSSRNQLRSTPQKNAPAANDPLGIR